MSGQERALRPPVSAARFEAAMQAGLAAWRLVQDGDAGPYGPRPAVCPDCGPIDTETHACPRRGGRLRIFAGEDSKTWCSRCRQRLHPAEVAEHLGIGPTYVPTDEDEADGILPGDDEVDG